MAVATKYTYRHPTIINNEKLKGLIWNIDDISPEIFEEFLEDAQISQKYIKKIESDITTSIKKQHLIS
jgi:hypothetical protein